MFTNMRKCLRIALVAATGLTVMPLAAAPGIAFAQAAPSPTAPGQTVIPTYNGIDPDTMVKVIIGTISTSQVTPDLTDPKSPDLKVQMPGGLSYVVSMDDCDGGQPNLCKSLEFRAMLAPGALNFSQINDFNETMRYATAYLTNKGVPELRMDANIRGGVTANFIAYDIRIFVKLVGDYVEKAK